MKKLLVSVLCVALLLTMAMAGWAKDKADITIVVMPKLVGIPYFNAAGDGAEKLGADLGIKVIYAGPTEADATQQYKMVEDFIAQGVDAIAVAPNDPAGLTPVLRKAKAAGIVVLDWDTAAEKDAVDYSIHNTDDREMGEHMWQRLFEAIGKKDGKYAILTGGLEAENLNTWIDYGLAWAKENYPDMQLVTDKIPTNEKQQEAYSKTLDLLKAYPDLDGIMGQSTPTPIGAGQAIQELGLQKKVALVGHTMPKDAAVYLKDGSIDTGVLWNVFDLGYLTAYIAYTKVIGGEITNGMEIPNVGKIEFRDDGKTIILGPPLDITAENVDSLKF
jgi:simple sugar transport system substrate-binding protein/rhamnose transport system substrate-binding protein